MTQRRRRNNKPKRSAMPGGSRSLLNGTDKPVTITGKYLFTVSQAASSDQLALSPNNFGSRATYLAACFREFRFTNIVIRAHPTSQDYVVAYLKAIGTGPPSLADAYQGTNSLLVSQVQTTPQTLTVKGLLSGVRPWYLCAMADGETLDYIQGSIFAYTTSTTAVLPLQIEVGYRITFRGAKDTNEN